MFTAAKWAPHKNRAKSNEGNLGENSLRQGQVFVWLYQMKFCGFCGGNWLTVWPNIVAGNVFLWSEKQEASSCSSAHNIRAEIGFSKKSSSPTRPSQTPAHVALSKSHFLFLRLNMLQTISAICAQAAHIQQLHCRKLFSSLWAHKIPWPKVLMASK